MFKSIKVYLRNKYIKSQETALRGFIQSLKGMDLHDLGGLVLSATAVRHSHRKNMGVDFLDPVKEIEKNPYVILDIGKVIKECQKMPGYGAAGCYYVWLHTFRSLSEPELRIYGIQLWETLQMGIQYIKDNPDTVANVKADIAGFDEVPLGCLII